MIDLQSIMGYAHNSPFNDSPYLDIKTPEGLITMENTPIDLMGIDNLGNVKKMKAGRKAPYKFSGHTVREIPVGNPFQKGGLSTQQLFNFIFDDEDEVKSNQQATAPTVDDIDNQNEMEALKAERYALQNQQEEMMAMNEALAEFTSKKGNPYGSVQKEMQAPTGNPYTGQIVSTGKFGNQNVGVWGKKIYGDLATHLGYAPAVNSIYRSKAQNDALIAAGKPASKTSYHLTGNAVDLKPADWHKLSNEQQQYYRQNYDVIYHDNHYHIEPK